MNSDTVLSALLSVLALMAVASVIEWAVPLREQARFTHGRVPTNLALVASNILVGLLLNAVLLTGSLWIGERGWGIFQLLDIGGIAATVLTIVLLDFAAYASHVALHKSPWLWRSHLVHHSDATVDATTSYRHHPIEPLFRWGVTALVAWSLGAPLAALALYRTLSALNAILEHANIRVPRWLDRSLIWFWVTPDMHKIHHSRVQSQTDSNYANLFSFYDRLFKTFTPTATAPAVQYGIEGFDTAERQTLPSLLRLPFVADREAIPPSDSMAVNSGRGAQIPNLDC